MSLEKQCRRKPDIEGVPIKLRGGEDWLIPKVGLKPVFEKEDGQWLLREFTTTEPYRSRYDRIRELWELAASEDSLSIDAMTNLQTATLELAAMALDQNYDLTADQLGDLIDPRDQAMTMSILAALRGMKLGTEKEKEELDGDEKKN